MSSVAGDWTPTEKARRDKMLMDKLYHGVQESHWEERPVATTKVKEAASVAVSAAASGVRRWKSRDRTLSKQGFNNCWFVELRSDASWWVYNDQYHGKGYSSRLAPAGYSRTGEVPLHWVEVVPSDADLVP